MDRTERFYKIDQLLRDKKCVPFSMLREKLEISPATLKRDIEYMRNRLNAPIVWDREARGYRFGEAEPGGGQYELPGLWFNASEIHALLTMMHLLSNIEAGGVLAPHVKPLTARLRALLGTHDGATDEIQKRVRILDMAARHVGVTNFEVVGSALLQRKRLQIVYYVRRRDETTEREVSPQRLVHYRDNWYLDAWCHLRTGLRSFALDAVRHAEVVGKRARDVPEKTLDAVLGAGYGIFSGRRVTWAALRFTRERARWVSVETWHPKQRARWEEDGSYVLELPFSDDRELVMDILKYGPDVEVLAPASLRKRIAEQLDLARRRY
jgi:predicted DNA-binding transcriptional regulator YafY